MNIVRWDPMRDLRQLSHRIEQSLGTFPAMEAEWPSAQMGAWPAVDVYEDREELVFRAELPGLEQKEVEVMLEDHTLTLRGERKLHREDKRENYQRIESSYGNFTRSFTLPATVDQDRVRAEMRSGILEVHVPKREGARGKTIPIKG